MVIGRYTSRGVAPPAAPHRVPGVRAPRAGERKKCYPLKLQSGVRASGGGAGGAVAGERPEGSGPPGSAYIGFLGKINIFFRVYSIRLYLLAIAF